jgi:hypothetical protein
MKTPHGGIAVDDLGDHRWALEVRSARQRRDVVVAEEVRVVADDAERGGSGRC